MFRIFFITLFFLLTSCKNEESKNNKPLFSTLSKAQEEIKKKNEEELYYLPTASNDEKSYIVISNNSENPEKKKKPKYRNNNPSQSEKLLRKSKNIPTKKPKIQEIKNEQILPPRSFGSVDKNASGENYLFKPSEEAEGINIYKNKFTKAYIPEKIVINGSATVEVTAFADEDNGDIKAGTRLFGKAIINGTSSRIEIVFDQAISENETWKINARAYSLNKTPGVLAKIDEHTITNISKKISNTATKISDAALSQVSMGITGGISDELQMQNSNISASVPADKQILIRFQ